MRVKKAQADYVAWAQLSHRDRNVLNSCKVLTDNVNPVDELFAWSTLNRSNFVCLSQQRERQGGGCRGRGWYRSPGIDYTEQWRADQEQPWPDGGDITVKLRHFHQTQNLTYIMWVCVCVRRGGRTHRHLSLSVCVCMCVLMCWGKGGWGLKWERKGDSDRLKKKWRKGGGDWPGAVSPPLP